jgi:hypothetical protein
MISDERGIPVEFKYTEPVTPTKLQKVLYGEVLEKYLREEIIISNLSGKIESKPDIYIVDDVKNLYLKNLVKESVVIVKATQLKPMKELNTFKFIKENEAVIQTEEDKTPIRLIITDDMVAQKDDIGKQVMELASGMDITEPLTRIQEALKLICKGEL